MRTQQVEWAVGSTSLQPMTGSKTADSKVLDDRQRISMVEAGLRHAARTADLDCFKRVVEAGSTVYGPVEASWACNGALVLNGRRDYRA